jgi:putative transposase
MPRLVVPGLPHHVTQRGSRRQPTFLEPGDFERYLRVMSGLRERAGVTVWAYCLMPNHVHLVVVPDREASLATWLGEGHRRYAHGINRRQDWCGHLWQERFRSCVMDERHLWAAVRYVELNPVRAGLCSGPADWAWSSARAHLAGRDDALVSVQPMLDRVGNWSEYLAPPPSEPDDQQIRQHAATGRPLGDASFVARLEQLTGRALVRQPRGPAPWRPPEK